MINKIVCDLEYAKELKDLGLRQDIGLFYNVYNKIKEENKLHLGLTECIKNHSESWEYIYRPTVAELGVMLPEKIETNIYDLEIMPILVAGEGFIWQVNYVNWQKESNLYTTEDKKEANARAMCLIYLLKNNLIKIEDVNKRLGVWYNEKD